MKYKNVIPLKTHYIKSQEKSILEIQTSCIMIAQIYILKQKKRIILDYTVTVINTDQNQLYNMDYLWMPMAYY